MPYIEQANRTRLLDSPLYELCQLDLSDGEINYILSLLLKQQFVQNPKYATINKLVGAVECAKQEFIRRYVNPYENQKILENGDI